MRKDKKWLKEKADRLFFDNSMSNNPYLVAKREAITEIPNLIDQLDEPEVLSQEWIDEHRESTFDLDLDEDFETVFIKVEDLQTLLAPKQYKPVIPQFVAEWIERQRKYEPEPVITAMNRLRSNGTRELMVWFESNPDLYARAWLDGYEVEKEKRYCVRENNFLLCKYKDEVIDYLGAVECGVTDLVELKLTEKEIKDYDERYWAFAEEVTE